MANIRLLKQQGLVHVLARRYANRFHVPYEDLVQEGNLGLIRAKKKFRPGRGCRFSTYAFPWIRSFLQRAVAEDRMIHIPEHAKYQHPERLPQDQEIRVVPDDLLLGIPDRPHAPPPPLGLKEALQEAIRSLPEHMREIIRARWIRPCRKEPTLDALGKRLGYSRERIRQLEAEALTKMKNHPALKGWDPAL